MTLSETEAKQLARVGINEPYQALLTVPRKFLDYTQVIAHRHIAGYIDQLVVFKCELTGRPQRKEERGRYSISLKTEDGIEYNPTLFGQPQFSPWKEIGLGQSVWIAATPCNYGSRTFLNGVSLLSESQVRRVVSVYPGKSGVVGAATISKAVALALSEPSALDDAVTAIREAFGGVEEVAIVQRAQVGGSLRFMLLCLHQAPSMELATWAANAVRRVAVEHLKFCAEAESRRPMRVSSVIRIHPHDLEALLQALPYKPTTGEESQDTAIRKMVELLEAPYAMDALLTADVGVGKTLCYMVPAVLAHKQGKRVGVMIPNTILGKQILTDFKECFPEVQACLVADQVKANDIPWDENPILIGTVKLLNIAQKKGWTPHFMVIDEQQKLSKEQRERLVEDTTNVLECTATPLPQTIALMTHGSKTRLVVSKQHVEKDIKSYLLRENDRQAIMNLMQRVIASGKQAAVVYPRVEEESEADARSVIRASKVFDKRFPGQVVALHGGLSAEEKAEAMAKAKSGEMPIIVSSTILEIGVTIRNLAMMLVVDADRFGVNALHQLRGRLCRNGGKGVFIAYVPSPDADALTEEELKAGKRGVQPEALERIGLLLKTNDGFKLAEMDMQIRGYGDLMGEDDRSSGKSRTLFRALDLMPEDFE